MARKQTPYHYEKLFGKAQDQLRDESISVFFKSLTINIFNFLHFLLEVDFMISERKLFWFAWYYRLTLLFGILSLLFSGYIYTFISPNTLKSYGSITLLLSFGMLFFSSFPEHRMNIRYNQLKKQLHERIDFDDTLSSEKSSKKGVIRFIKFKTALMIMFVFVILNILLAAKVYSNNNHPRMFLHMVVIITAFFLYNASLQIYMVDETFKKIEGLISQFGKNQASKRTV